MSWAATASRSNLADLPLAGSQKRAAASRDVRRSSARPTGRLNQRCRRSANFRASQEAWGRAVGRGLGKPTTGLTGRHSATETIADGGEAVIVAFSTDDGQRMSAAEQGSPVATPMRFSPKSNASTVPSGAHAWRHRKTAETDAELLHCRPTCSSGGRSKGMLLFAGTVNHEFQASSSSSCPASQPEVTRASR